MKKMTPKIQQAFFTYYAMVLEDNAGGLSLHVTNDYGDICLYAKSGYEHNPGQLTQDLEALKNTSVASWEGNDAALVAEWPIIEGTTRKIVADEVGNKLHLHHDKMGIAARREFGSES